ncbi:MAG: hypothetical protein K0S23_1772 [Fluviicola sp.]|jgi:hypothetical protein|nr:hypothetical protein [Fluviicola sp.]
MIDSMECYAKIKPALTPNELFNSQDSVQASLYLVQSEDYLERNYTVLQPS